MGKVFKRIVLLLMLSFITINVRANDLSYLKSDRNDISLKAINYMHPNVISDNIALTEIASVDFILLDTNTSTVTGVSCGGLKNLPEQLPKLTSIIFDLIKVTVPIGIVIKGMIDIAKAVASQKEDEIKKGTQMFVKRLIAGAIVFLVILITETIFNIVGSDIESNTLSKCINCFVNNICE